MKHDPSEYRPYTEAEWKEDGWFPPDNSVEVGLDEMIPFLEVHRDQWLWFALLEGLNYDIKGVADVAAWILDQNDCDIAVAVLAYSFFDGPYFCGCPTTNQFSADSDELIPLIVIEKRNQSRPYTRNDLLVREKDLQRGGPEQLLKASRDAANVMFEKAKREVEKSGVKLVAENLPIPLLTPPIDMLSTPLNGSSKRIGYVVDEHYVTFVPKEPLSS